MAHRGPSLLFTIALLLTEVCMCLLRLSIRSVTVCLRTPSFNKKSQSNLGRPRRRPSRREWTRLLRVLLAVQCPLQTSPSLSRGYAASTPQYHILPTRYIALLLRPPFPEKIYPLKTQPPAHPTHHSKQQNWRIYSEFLLLLLAASVYNQ